MTDLRKVWNLLKLRGRATNYRWIPVDVAEACFLSN